MTDTREIVKLNVGGTIYHTTKVTLANSKSRYFEVLTDTIMNNNLDENGNIFIDRNGRLFEFVLDYLRSSIFPEMTVELKHEFEFYAINLPVDKHVKSFSRENNMNDIINRRLIQSNDDLSSCIDVYVSEFDEDEIICYVFTLYHPTDKKDISGFFFLSNCGKCLYYISSKSAESYDKLIKSDTLYLGINMQLRFINFNIIFNESFVKILKKSTDSDSNLSKVFGMICTYYRMHKHDDKKID